MDKYPTLSEDKIKDYYLDIIMIYKYIEIYRT